MADRASTIFAVSSGRPPSGIAVVRVSGPQATTALSDLAGLMPMPRVATRAVLKAVGGEPIDDGLVLFFPAPRSATGEDVAEFHVHGGRAVLAALLSSLGAIDGLRPAEPGEFTRRGFENGKLDLVAAEALDDLIHADTEQQRRQAMRQLGGLLGDRARGWRQRIIDASALIEASIDFADESDVGGELIEPAREAAETLCREIESVLTCRSGERLRDGLVVAIAGPPNAGKSSLLNALVGRDVAIVTPYAGTTRDVIEVHLDLNGFPATLIDTAGLRQTDDPVEREGIDRAIARAQAADLVLWLTELGRDRTVPPFAGAPIWSVATKGDLGIATAAPVDHVISAQTGDGLATLIDALSAFAETQCAVENGMVTRARHRQLLSEAADALRATIGERDAELIAEGLRTASQALGRLLGQIDVDDVLGSIFSRFCIGK